MTESEPTLVSIHIPKTGGSTLLTILEQVYGNRLQLAYGDERDTLVEHPLCYHGHAVLDNFAAALNALAKARWITFLREPLSSAVSFYHYGVSRGTVQEVGLRQWLTGKQEFCWPNPPVYNHNRFSKWIARARTSWEQFDIICITEYFNDSIRLISQELNWPEVDCTSQNVGSYDDPDLSGSTIEEFRRLNSEDYHVYGKAVKRLQSQQGGAGNA